MNKIESTPFCQTYTTHKTTQNNSSKTIVIESKGYWKNHKELIIKG